MGSKKISNFCWACILFLGSLGFLLVGTCSYFGRNLISLFPTQQIVFFTRDRNVSYLWCTISWSVGSGYDKFDRKEGIVCIFHWGFLRRNHHIFFRFRIRDIYLIIIEVKEGLFPCRVLYIEIGGQGYIPLMRTDENLTPRKIEQKAAKPAYFLCIPIEVF
ncbi:unnamed protein product [Victoria cruziana]